MCRHRRGGIWRNMGGYDSEVVLLVRGESLK